MKNLEPIFFACYHNNAKLVRLLVENGANVNFQDKMKCTPLIYACKNKNTKLVKYLVEKGANIHHRNFWNFNAMSYANYVGCTSIIKYLSEKGLYIYKNERIPYHIFGEDDKKFCPGGYREYYLPRIRAKYGTEWFEREKGLNVKETFVDRDDFVSAFFKETKSYIATKTIDTFKIEKGACYSEADIREMLFKFNFTQ